MGTELLECGGPRDGRLLRTCRDRSEQPGGPGAGAAGPFPTCLRCSCIRCSGARSRALPERPGMTLETGKGHGRGAERFYRAVNGSTWPRSSPGGKAVVCRFQ